MGVVGFDGEWGKIVVREVLEKGKANRPGMEPEGD